MLAVCAAVLGVPTGKGRPLVSVLNSEAEGLLRKTEQVKTQIETLKGKIESLKQKGGEVCTDINLANGKLSKGSLGGLDKCCNVCEDDASKVCCPTKKCTDSKGNGGRKANKDGKGTYCPEENVKDTVFEVDPKKTDVPGFYTGNMCPGVLEEDTTTCGKKGGDSCLRFDGIGASAHGPKVSMVVTNVNAYNPVWPYHDTTNVEKFQSKKGWLFNGKKADTNLVDDIFQLNLCNNRHLKTRYSFVDEHDEPIKMKRAAIRLFDLDQGKNGGPETVQFMCSTSESPGGTFTLFGDHSQVIHSSGNVKLRETVPGATPRGSAKHVFHCPQDEYVTLWATRLGDLSDNPDNVDEDKLTKEQESSMVLINFTYVEHFDMVFANMPEQYRQESCTDFKGNPGFETHKGGATYCPLKHVRRNYAFADAGECPEDSPNCAEDAHLRGNPLNSSLEINPENYPGLGSGNCGLDDGGRNWMVAGLSGGEVAECAPAPPPAPSPPPQRVTVGGDPIFTVGDKTNTTHVWLPYGELTRLLRWTLPGGRAMELLGKTFHQVEHGTITDNEWFGQFVLKHGLQTVLDVSADQDELGSMRVVFDGKVAEPMPGELVYTSKTHHQIKFTVSETPDNDQFTVHGRRGRRLHVEAGGVEMAIHMAKASKFKKERDRIKWAHLNVNLNSGLPEDSSGIFAELVGIQPLSPATKELLVRPEWAVAYAVDSP